MVEYRIPIAPKSVDRKKWRIVSYTISSEGKEILIARTYGLRNLRLNIEEELQTVGIERALSGIIITGAVHLLTERDTHFLDGQFLLFHERKFVTSRTKIHRSIFSPEENILVISPC